jgi:ubiquinone/menaquinone biosynthesis C-methylase UbiE
MPRRSEGSWYLPGRFYDLAFGLMFRGLRRRVARTVEREKLYPWLDICCGTGDQLRYAAPGRPVFGLDKSFSFMRYAAARAPGIPFVCGDAARLPFKDSSMKAVSVSFGLHDKGAELREAILSEAARTLAPGGRLVAVDFERAWDRGSKVGASFSRAVESLAGREHYRNGRDFLRRGGLRTFLRDGGFFEVERRNVPFGAVSVVVARAGPNGPCAPPPSE